MGEMPVPWKLINKEVLKKPQVFEQKIPEHWTSLET